MAAQQVVRVITSSGTAPPHFSDGDLLEWFQKFTDCADANEWTREQRLQKVPAYLDGRANQLFHQLLPAQRDTWEHLRTNLTGLFYPPESQSARQIELESIRYNLEESIESYKHRIERQFAQAYPELEGDGFAVARLLLLKRNFVSGLPAIVSAEAAQCTQSRLPWYRSPCQVSSRCRRVRSRLLSQPFSACS